MRYPNPIYLGTFLFLLIFGNSDAFFSKSALNCKYQLLPEYIDGIGDGDDEIYYSDIRGVTHKPENKIFLNIKYESVVTISIEKSYDSDLDLSYIHIITQHKEEPFSVIEGNLTWGGAGNNTRLFLRSRLKPSHYIILIGSSFHKNDEIEKVDNSVCSPVNFEFGLTTPEILNSQQPQTLNNPFNKPVVTISMNEKYQYSNKLNDLFVVKTTPFGINSSNNVYKGNVLWSKLFVVPPSKTKEDEDLLNLNVELGFRFTRTPLQLLIEPMRTNRAKYESKSKGDDAVHLMSSQRIFFGTPIFNGQLFKESISLKSFRILVLAPWMSDLPDLAMFDLKISISFQSHGKQVINNFLTNQNECNLQSLPTKIVQGGLFLEEVQSLKDPGEIPIGHYHFGDKVDIQGVFESLISKTNHLIHLVISKPSVIYLISYHDHSDVDISLSKSSFLSDEDEDLEFYLDDEDLENPNFLEEYENIDKDSANGRSGSANLRSLKNSLIVCSTTNLNKRVTNREMSLIYCRLDETGDYFLHLHSFKISESQNSISLCTPFHLKLQIIPSDKQNNSALASRSLSCQNPLKLSTFRIPINRQIDTMGTNKHSILLENKYDLDGERVHLFHKQELKVSEEDNHIFVQLTIPENPEILVFLNILYKDKIWMSLSPHDLHNYYSSSGPVIPGTYTIQLFFMVLEKSTGLNSNSNCLTFGLNFSLVKLVPSPRDTLLESDYGLYKKCMVTHMSLPKVIDLRSNSKSEDYILDGAFLVPFGGQDEYSTGEVGKEDSSVLREASYSYVITLKLARPSVIYSAISSYNGMVFIHATTNKMGKKRADSEKRRVGSSGQNSFHQELGEGEHDLILEFDLLEDSLEENVQEGTCPIFKFHLSVTPLELLPVFPPLGNRELHKYVFGSYSEKSPDKRTHSEILSASKDYLANLFPERALYFDLTKSVLAKGGGSGSDKKEQDDGIKYINYRGSSIDILDFSFWYSPFMRIEIPLETEFEETMFVIRISTSPAWLPISLRLINSAVTQGEGSSHRPRHGSVHLSGNTAEFSFSGLKKGSYRILIQSKSQFNRNTMNRATLMRLSGFFKPVLNNRLFSLRQELLSIPDILPFQELPDSLNRARFFSEISGRRGLVGTIIFNFREVKKTSLTVPQNMTLLVRFLLEPTLVSVYDFYVTILKTMEDDNYIDNKPVFRSGRYGDTFVLLDSGTYDFYFEPNPGGMPFLLTFGITKFSPGEYEDYFRRRVSFPRDSFGMLSKYVNSNVNSNFNILSKSNMDDIFGPKPKCHFYLNSLDFTLNENNDPYFNSGVINICQGSFLKSETKLSAFSSGFHDIELNVGSSSMVYFHVNSDFLYSFYRIGIIVPEGYWVAEQRGKRSYLEVELTKGNYKLRIESLNSFVNFEEHELVIFSMYVEISPIDGSETSLKGDGIVDNSLDLFDDKGEKHNSAEHDKSSEKKGLYNNNRGAPESLCNIPNGVPLPLDLTSIHGGSTVFGGPLDTNKSMFLFRSRITLTDIHNGRKKVFLELNRKYFPIYLRLLVSPVNFEISESPNMLEVLFTRINSNKIEPIYSNSDNEVNSIEKVFKIDLDSVQEEQKSATHIPYWLTFTHKLDSTSSRIPCIAFDIVSHVVSVGNKELRFGDMQNRFGELSASASSLTHHIDEIENKINNALKAGKLPQYVHIPVPSTPLKLASNILDLRSGEFEKDIQIDLRDIDDLNQALLIAELYYNPLLNEAKMTLYSESLKDDEEVSEELGELNLLKSSKVGFNGDIKNPLYAKETLSVILTPQKHVLECYVKSLPPFNLRKVPVKIGLSLIPLDHKLFGDDPLILYISPDTSVPILAGQNYHISLKLSTPVKNEKNHLADSFYILNRRESLRGGRVEPYSVQILDSGYSIGINFRYNDIIKVLSDDADQFTKRGFLVLETQNIHQRHGNGKHGYRLAPWLKSYLVEHGKTYLEITCYKTNSLGWANIVWNGNLDDGKSSKVETQTSNLRVQSNDVEIGRSISGQRDSVTRDALVSYNKLQTKSNGGQDGSVNGGDDINSSEVSPQSFVDTYYEVEGYHYSDVTRDVGKGDTKWIVASVCVFLVLLFLYRSQIYKLAIYIRDHVGSYFDGHKDGGGYNLIEERNNFDFLNNIESEEEDDRQHTRNQNLNRDSSPDRNHKQCNNDLNCYDLPYSPPPGNKKEM